MDRALFVYLSASALLWSLIGLFEADAQYCFKTIKKRQNSNFKCNGLISVADTGTVADAIECCNRGAAGWTTRRKGGKCTPCEDILGAVQPEPGWADWAEWTTCSATCGTGWKMRYRSCQSRNVACEGDKKEIRPCTILEECPVDGNWGSWNGWQSHCSTTCGEGRQLRVRACNNPPPSVGGRYCPGEAEYYRKCKIMECPIDGQWGSWSAFSQCAGPAAYSCGKDGFKTRTRQCDNPVAKYGGEPCAGSSREKVQCDLKPCPVNGGWSEFSQWSECSSTCGRGEMYRSRNCSQPVPAHGGKDCEGKATEKRRCRVKCKIDGKWGPWSDWGSCSHSCGPFSFRQRIRLCNNPQPLGGGKFCVGMPFDIDSCWDSPPCNTPKPGCRNSEASGENAEGSGSDDCDEGSGKNDHDHWDDEDSWRWW